MRIVILCEGRTEAALNRGLRELFQQRSGARRVGLETRPVPRSKLPRLVERFGSSDDVAGIIALTDVYPDFESADEAKACLVRLAGQSPFIEKFRAHVAQFELESWMMPFWDDIAKSIGVEAKKPGEKPEEINHEKPPSKHLKELFRRAKQPRRNYDKVRYASKWLTAKRLGRAAEVCPELKALLTSLLELAGGEALP